MKKKDSWSVERQLACVALLLLMGLLGGAALGKRLLRLGGGVPNDGRSRHQTAGAAMSGRAAALWSRLLAALSYQGSGPFTIERLVRLLLGHGGDPLAQAFAEDFLRDPKLRAIWNEYVRSGDKLDAAWLARRLSESKSFTALLNRYSQRRRFRRLGEALARDLSGESMQAGITGILGAAELAGERAGASGRGRLGHDGGSARASSGRGPAGADADAGAEATPATGDAGRQRARPPDEAYQTLRLIAPHAAGGSVARDPWASLCFQNDPSITREQCSAINRHLGEEALWNACLKAGLLDKCVSLCRGNLELGCEAQARELQECRSRRSEAECADACSRGDCRAAAQTPGLDPAADVAAAPRGEGAAGPEPSAPQEPSPRPSEEPGPSGDGPTSPAATTPEPPSEPGFTLPADRAVPRVAPTPPPQPASQPRRRIRLPGWVQDIIDFFDDLLG